MAGGPTSDSRSLVALAGQIEGHETRNNAEAQEDQANPADYPPNSALAEIRHGFRRRADAGSLAFDHSDGEQKTDVQSLLFGPGRFATTYASGRRRPTPP